ncbi:MAG: GNAT family N-acetyltransferase [Bacteroidetes bacterium]|nr:GNAT family N-acetyltransferase [Bacteroidota bacterium]
MITLTGKFITLKPMTIEHAEFVVKMRNLEHARFVNRGSATVEQQIDWIKSRPSNEINWMIYFQDQVIGQISLYTISEQHKTAEAGRLMLSPDIPKGYPISFEAILLVNTYAFYELKLNKVYGIVGSMNTGALKLNDFIKMKREGVLREHFIFDYICQDCICFGILRDEFIKVQEPFLKKVINLNKY